RGEAVMPISAQGHRATEIVSSRAASTSRFAPRVDLCFDAGAETQRLLSQHRDTEPQRSFSSRAASTSRFALSDKTRTPEKEPVSPVALFLAFLFYPMMAAMRPSKLTPKSSVSSVVKIFFTV